MATVDIPSNHPANASSAGGSFTTPPSLLTNVSSQPVEPNEGAAPAPHGGHRMKEDGHAGHGKPQADAKTQTQIDALTKAFTEFSAKLSQDQPAKTGKDMESLRGAATELAKSDDPAVRAGAQSVLKALPGADVPADLAKLRESLKQFSGPTIELIRQFPASGKGTKAFEAYCPMVKASWVQSSEQIKNPYYGSSMLTCGTIKGSLTRTD